MNNNTNGSNKKDTIEKLKKALSHKVAPVALAVSTLFTPALAGCREKEVIPGDIEYPGENCTYFVSRNGKVIFSSGHQISNREAFNGSDYYYVKMSTAFSNLILDYKIAELKGELNEAKLNALFKQYQYDSMAADYGWYAFKKSILGQSGIHYSINTQNMLQYATEKGMVEKRKVVINGVSKTVEYPVSVDKLLEFSKKPNEATKQASFPSERALQNLDLSFNAEEAER